MGFIIVSYCRWAKKGFNTHTHPYSLTNSKAHSDQQKTRQIGLRTFETENSFSTNN
jgi:hypothetical protein